MVMGTDILEEEILIDILTKLPVKSLFRFKCVSKSCKTLLAEPYFKKKHHNHAKNQPDSQKLLIVIGGKNLNFYCTSLSPNRLLVNDIHTAPKPFSRYKMYCCCDALFLIGIWTGLSRDQPTMLLLWNPTTSESIVLPPLESPEQESTYGLGYDSTSDDYKVLRIDKEGTALDEIVALKIGSWRKIYSPSVRPVGDGFILYGKECLSFVNGAFHWLGIDSSESMMSLNISDETYKRIPLPKNVGLYPESVTIEEGISVLGSMICLFNSNEITFNLWIVKEYGVQESWIKLLTLPCNGAFSVIPIYSFSDGKVLLRYKCRDELRGIKVIYRTCDDQIWSFDIDPLSFILDGFVYMESLINPREIDAYPIHKQTNLAFLRKRKREGLLE
ncbi:F-box/kelch-repeat protein At3g23880-like [Solanum verrucosum]|nr:F-box/kelch-repeat protein At3g23880-like [Solanum verrucosum]